MLSAIRSRITYVNVVATLVLLFAMTGGALAAKKYLITSTKQISPSVLKQLQGKAGRAGAPGTAGAQGLAGSVGPGGPAGSAGSKGETGPAGAKGEKGATGAAGAKGATGATGTTGFTETLPSGKTEMGNWSASGFGSPGEVYPFAISFPIPLAEPSTKVVLLTKEQTQNSVVTPIEGCKLELGVQAAKPVAPAGTLCVFTRVQEQGEPKFVRWELGNEGDSPAGAYIWVLAEAATPEIGVWNVSGTWAVTAK